MVIPAGFLSIGSSRVSVIGPSPVEIVIVAAPTNELAAPIAQRSVPSVLVSVLETALKVGPVRTTMFAPVLLPALFVATRRK